LTSEGNGEREVHVRAQKEAPAPACLSCALRSLSRSRPAGPKAPMSCVPCVGVAVVGRSMEACRPYAYAAMQTTTFHLFAQTKGMQRNHMNEFCFDVPPGCVPHTA
jgi:hypothetical protein